MPKDAYDKLKVISDVIKNNWPLVLICMTAIGSGLTNLNQYFIGVEDDELKNAMAEQITIMAKPVIEKKVVVKSTCSLCGNYLKKSEYDKHINEYNELHK